jgi:DNA polymerase V
MNMLRISLDLVPAGQLQESLFSDRTWERDSGLMQTLDTLREKCGHGVVRYGVQATGKKWQLRSDNFSPCYTTRLEGLIMAS